MRGRFHFKFSDGEQHIIDNIITDQGEEDFLKMIFPADNIILPSGNNWYVGLCEQAPVETDTLVSITTEPTSAGGYARLAIARNGTGWPLVDVIKVNDAFRALSLQITFTASGADFSRSIQRAFLCNVASGTSGRLFSYSGLLPNPRTILDTETLVMKYEVFLR